MTTMPESRALLAVDVVASSAFDDDMMAEVRPTLDRLLHRAFETAKLDITARTNLSATGDGALMSFPESFLPGLVDLAHDLEVLLYQHNRRSKLEIPMRMSVHVGPLRVTDAPSFQRSYVELTQMLEAPELKRVVRRCRQAGLYTLALIVSGRVYRQAVRGQYTRHLRPHHFAELSVRGHDLEERCWLHVPGFDAARVTEYAAGRAPQDGSAPDHPGQVNRTVIGINGSAG